MQEIIPMMDDFLDTIWDFDESWYNGRKSSAEVDDGSSVSGKAVE